MQIPVQVSPDEFAMAFYYYDPRTGELEGLPLAELTRISVSCPAHNGPETGFGPNESRVFPGLLPWTSDQAQMRQCAHPCFSGGKPTISNVADATVTAGSSAKCWSRSRWSSALTPRRSRGSTT